MALPNMSGVGRLTAPVELRFSPQGTAVAEIRLAFNSRKLDRDTNEWRDDAVFFVRAKAFKRLAEGAAESLDQGDEVVVSGRLQTDQWTDKQSGEKRSAVSLLLDSIGPNLTFATAKVSRVDRSHAGGSAAQPDRSSDPWGNTATADAESVPF